MKKIITLICLMFGLSAQAQTWFIPWDLGSGGGSTALGTNFTVSGNVAVTNTPNVSVANTPYVVLTNSFLYLTNSMVGVTNTQFAVNVTNASLNVNITNTSLNVNVTNAYLNVTNTILVGITNTSLTVDATNGSFKVNITNASVNVNVTNTTLIANVTNASFNVNVTNAALNVNVTNAAGIRVISTNDTHALRYGPSFLFNAATISSNSPAIDVSWYNKHSFQYWLTGTVTNLYLYFESSLDGTNYNKEVLLIPTYTTNALVPLSGITKYLRATATNGPLGAAYGGSVNVMLMSGN